MSLAEHLPRRTGTGGVDGRTSLWALRPAILPEYGRVSTRLAPTHPPARTWQVQQAADPATPTASVGAPDGRLGHRRSSALRPAFYATGHGRGADPPSVPVTYRRRGVTSAHPLASIDQRPTAPASPSCPDCAGAVSETISQDYSIFWRPLRMRLGTNHVLRSLDTRNCSSASLWTTTVTVVDRYVAKLGCPAHHYVSLPACQPATCRIEFHTRPTLAGETGGRSAASPVVVACHMNGNR